MLQSLPDMMFDIARAQARKHRLVRGDTLWCWNCYRQPALMPSLHCAACLDDSHRRSGRAEPLCQNREQTPADVEACRVAGPDRMPPAPRVPPIGTFAAHAHPEDQPETWERD